MDTLSSSTSLINSNSTTESLSSVNVQVTRPVTSKARGVCKYYTDPRGCYARDKCKFLHSEPPKEGESPIPTPYDSSKTCRFYAQGYCRRGDQCWFLHTDPKGRGALEEEDDLCSICFEKPTTYGLLTGCSHIFCTTCIKQWRDPQRKPIGVVDSGNTKRCPMCRAPSRFITPSSKFWHEGSEEKQKTIESYRESMSRVQCRFFQKSIKKERLICPFGNECFYQHRKPDGTLHLFRDGVEASMRRYRIGHQNNGPFSIRLGEVPFIPDLANLTLAAALDMNPNWFEQGPDAPNRPPHEIGMAFDTLLRSHLRESVMSAGSNQPGQDGGDAPTGEALMVMRLLDAVRDQLMPGIRSATAGTPNSHRTRANATRNGTASVADEADDEPPPPLEPLEADSRANGYESDASMPGLRSVSNSSESSGDLDDDGDDDSSDDNALNLDQDGDEVDPARLFRQLFGIPEFPNSEADAPTPESRPASSARFRTFVDRPNTTNLNPTSSGSAPTVSPSSTGAQMDPPMSLLEWAEAIIGIDEFVNNDNNDNSEEDMPPLEPIPNQHLGPSTSRTNDQNGSGQPQNYTPQPETAAEGDGSPALELPVQPLPSSTTSVRPPGGEATRDRINIGEDATTPHKRSGEQEFTTDGRGRVISIGGPEPPIEIHALSRSHSQSQSQKYAVNDKEEERNTDDHTAHAPPPMQRQTSEFTTDGRGRVISVGDPFTPDSDARDAAGTTENGASGERGNEVNGNGLGLFAWFNALF